jgi:hypothetical protein
MSETPYETAIAELKASTAEFRPSDVMLFSEPLRSALNFAIRSGKFNLTEFAQKLGFTRAEAKRVADILVERRLLTVSTASTAEEIFYESRLSALSRPARRAPSDLWNKIG